MNPSLIKPKFIAIFAAPLLIWAGQAVAAETNVNSSTATVWTVAPPANVQEKRNIRLYSTPIQPTTEPSPNYGYISNNYNTVTNYAAPRNNSNPRLRSASTDRIGQLIYASEVNRPYQGQGLTVEQNTRIRPVKSFSSTNGLGNSDDDEDYSNGENNLGIIRQNLDFNQWLNTSSYRANQVAQYQSYLATRVGAYNVPPMNQLLTTARSWEKCGYEPYQLPPQGLWSNMVPTLHLYSRLKSMRILPQETEIRSVYRPPALNRCAGGAASSKHITNGAIDIWVPSFEGQPWYLQPLRDDLCRFWNSEGETYNFGLGLYSTAAIHLDTQGHRIWGRQHTTPDSICRYVESNRIEFNF